MPDRYHTVKAAILVIAMTFLFFSSAQASGELNRTATVGSGASIGIGSGIFRCNAKPVELMNLRPIFRNRTIWARGFAHD